MTVKVKGLDEATTEDTITVQGDPLRKKNFTVADASGGIVLTAWENVIDQLFVGSCYSIDIPILV